MPSEAMKDARAEAAAAAPHSNQHGTDSGPNEAPAASTGMQLLSPTLCASMRVKDANQSAARISQSFGWDPPSPSPSVRRTRVQARDIKRSDEDEAASSSAGSRTNSIESMSSAKGSPPTQKKDLFDFDSFTLASVAQRQDRRTREKLVKSQSVASTASARSPPSVSNQESHQPVLGDHSTDMFAPASFEQQYQQLQQQVKQQQQQQCRVRSSLHGSSISSSTGSTDQTPPTALGYNRALGMPPPSQWAAQTGGGSRSRGPTAVLATGWLQRRKGVVLKRWRPYFGVFKDDDALCLYASEDTVNGRLALRFAVLRVLLTDKNDSFHVIGVDLDGAPRREELRASVSVDWQRWFLVFRRFFDADSLHEALVRKPELMLMSPPPRAPPRSTGSASDNQSQGQSGAGWDSYHVDMRSTVGNQDDDGEDGYSTSDAGDEPPSLGRHASRGPNWAPRATARGTSTTKSVASTATRDSMGDDVRSTMSLLSAASVAALRRRDTASDKELERRPARPSSVDIDRPEDEADQAASSDCPLLERESCNDTESSDKPRDSAF